MRLRLTYEIDRPALQSEAEAHMDARGFRLLAPEDRWSVDDYTDDSEPKHVVSRLLRIDVEVPVWKTVPIEEAQT